MKQVYEDLCSECKKIGDCEDWLRLIRTDDAKDLESYGFRTLTVVYDCRQFEELEDEL